MQAACEGGERVPPPTGEAEDAGACAPLSDFLEPSGAGGDDEAAAISSLRRILRAYAALDKECGYCQGMNYVAGLLLLACDSASRSPNDPCASSDAADDEERCFWLLVATAPVSYTHLTLPTKA